MGIFLSLWTRAWACIDVTGHDMPHACEVMMDIYLSFEHTKFTFSINEYPEAFGPDTESQNIEITPLKTQLSSPLKIFTMYLPWNFSKKST